MAEHSLPKPGSVSLVTNKTTAFPATLELGLVLEDILIKPTHAVLNEAQFNPDNGERHIREQWDIFWCSEKKLIRAKFTGAKRKLALRNLRSFSCVVNKEKTDRNHSLDIELNVSIIHKK